ncbi:unnamed protein product [Bursaphelenchus xylophilus]|nr:unnamed protein product [Bursaphelenchus xylophilus]CAG9119429.1 unnamed protein product [Bursaphelenchus xylophilus]
MASKSRKSSNVSKPGKIDPPSRTRSGKRGIAQSSKDLEDEGPQNEEDLIYGDSKALHRNNKSVDRRSANTTEEGDESDTELLSRRNRRIDLPRYIWNGDLRFSCYSELMMFHFRDLDKHLPVFRKYADNNEVVVVFRSLPNLDNFMKSLIPNPENSKIAVPFFRTIERFLRYESSKNVVDVLCGFMRLNATFTAIYFVNRPYDLFHVRMARMHLSVDRNRAQRFFEIRPDLLTDAFEASVEWADVQAWAVDEIHDLRTRLSWISYKHGIELDSRFEEFVRRFIMILSPKFEVQSLRARAFLTIMEVFIKTNPIPYSVETVTHLMLICATFSRAIPEHYSESLRKEEIQLRVFLRLTAYFTEIRNSLDELKHPIREPAQQSIDKTLKALSAR